jgi:hypothetical protein
VGDGARVNQTDDHLVIFPLGSREAHCTFTATHVGTGCFWGTHAEFVARIETTHGDNEYAKRYLAALAFAKATIPAPNPKEAKTAEVMS